MCIWLGEYPPYVPHKSGRWITQIATGWYLIESWGIWLIVAAAVLGATMIVSNKTGRKG